MLRSPLLVLAIFLALSAPADAAQDRRPPNVLLVFTDDQGYGDLSCHGHPTIRTPAIDALAAQGLRATQFYVASPVCSPSRAALLTGCYPKRVGMHEHVVFPPDDHGLHTDEETLADLLRAAGYRTGCFGKWHLGHRPGQLPTDQGFDVYAGVPYSNDMAQFHRKPNAKYTFRLPWMEGEEVVEWEPDQRLLTKRQTDAAIAFIEADSDAPFFAYVPYSMPHIPIYASAEFEGTSAAGIYGDVIEEIDASVGRLCAALERRGVADDTIVIFTSDNGPWLQFGDRGGVAGPLRGGKGTNWEGGQRVPFVLRWPARVAPGRLVHDVVTALDIVPTLAAVTGAPAPKRVIDGRDVAAMLFDGERQAPDAAPFLYYTSRGALAGIRRGPWKLMLESGALYHLERDVGEKRDRSEQNDELCEELRALAVGLDEAITRDARPHLKVAETLFDPAR
ncbi:MAG: sulfatase [Planctomycetota bacterium]